MLDFYKQLGASDQTAEGAYLLRQVKACLAKVLEQSLASSTPPYQTFDVMGETGTVMDCPAQSSEAKLCRQLPAGPPSGHCGAGEESTTPG